MNSYVDGSVVRLIKYLPTSLSLQLKSLNTAIPHLKAARKAISSKAYQKAVDEATRALEVGPNSVELREIRVKAYEGAGDLEGLIGDLRFVPRYVTILYNPDKRLPFCL